MVSEDEYKFEDDALSDEDTIDALKAELRGIATERDGVRALLATAEARIATLEEQVAAAALIGRRAGLREAADVCAVMAGAAGLRLEDAAAELRRMGGKT